ncbi:SRPBCC family protein [Pedobacter sp. PWIIR3]
MNINNLKSNLSRGFIVSNLFAMVAVGCLKYLSSGQSGSQNSANLIFSTFIIVPFVMGIINAWFWNKIETVHKTKTFGWYSVLNSLIAIFLSAVFLGEGVVCLLIVSPLIFALNFTGLIIGKMMFRKKNNTLNVSVFSILLLVFLVDSISEHSYVNLVADEVVINACPEEVWKHVVAFEKIEEKPKYWLFNVGMPSPMQTTVDGYYEGSGRKCIFSNGYVFDEKIVTYQPNKNLTFDIVGQPLDPEIMGHIDILRGQFLLKDNRDGTTTLVGNSWYRLHVFPIWYYDIWAKSVTRNVHLRVMEHIKELSEN